MSYLNRRAAIALGCGTAASLATPGLVRAGSPIRLGVTATGILVWLADGMGLLADSPHNFELIRYASGTKTAKDVVAGDLDLATSSEFAFVSMGFDRPDLRILASISQSRTVDVFARADRGIRDYPDLTGKTVGLVPNSFAHFALSRVLLESNAEVGKLKPLRPAELVEAITNGSIDAGVIWEPFVRKASMALGDQFVLLPHKESHNYQFILHGTDAWISAHDEVATDLVAMLVRAAEFAEEDPNAAKRIVGSRLELDAETMDYLWPKHTLKMSLSQALLRLMEDEAWFRIDLGLSDGDVPDFLEMISPDALRQADPRAISIIGLT